MKKAYEIKRAQKASLFLRSIMTLFSQATRDDDKLGGISVSRVEMSPDKSTCFVYFYTPGGLAEFEEKFRQIVLYKPSMRAALAKQIAGRYTPELVFKYDSAFEKGLRIEKIFADLKEQEELQELHNEIQEPNEAQDEFNSDEN